MIENQTEVSKGMENALKALEQAKARVAAEKRKASNERRKQENHCKYIMGGIVHKYFPEYIAGGFISTIDRQIASEVEESKVHGSGITVATFIKMIEKNSELPYTHGKLRDIFSLDREIKLMDI